MRLAFTILATAFFTLATTPAHAELKWNHLRQQVIVEPKVNKVEAEFVYTNKGKTEVVIQKVRGACACCTKAKATLKRVPPGGSGSVKVWASLQNKPLPLVKAISVTTDDGKVTVLLVEAKAAK